MVVADNIPQGIVVTAFADSPDKDMAVVDMNQRHKEPDTADIVETEDIVMDIVMPGGYIAQIGDYIPVEKNMDPVVYFRNLSDMADNKPEVPVPDKEIEVAVNWVEKACSDSDKMNSFVAIHKD